MGAIVDYQLKDSIAVITMDDGKANAMSLEMEAALNRALDRAVDDNAVAVITGRQGIFSAGFHLPTLQAGGRDAVDMLINGFELAYRLLSFPQPVVIACNGNAVAMGLFLAQCGDYRIGIDGPYKIVANEVAIGLTVPWAAIAVCRDRLTPAHFNRALLNSERYTPSEAIPAGFLDRVVSENALMEEAQAKAVEYSKLNMAAYQGTKARVRGKMLEDLRAAIEADRTSFREIFGYSA